MTKRTLLGAALLLLPGVAIAQPAPGGAQPKPAARAPAAKLPPEIERGLYAEFDFGTLMYLGDAGANVQPGVMAGFAVGADIGEYLKVEGRMLNATNDSSGKFFKVNGQPPAVITANPCPDGDPNAACAQAPDVQSSLVVGNLKGAYSLSDRLQVHGLVGGGLLMTNPAPEQIFEFDAEAHITDPKSVEAGSTAVFGGGFGMQYYTRLRHFSVGTDLAVYTGGGGLIVTIYPTIKYTF